MGLTLYSKQAKVLRRVKKWDGVADPKGGKRWVSIACSVYPQNSYNRLEQAAGGDLISINMRPRGRSTDKESSLCLYCTI